MIKHFDREEMRRLVERGLARGLIFDPKRLVAIGLERGWLSFPEPNGSLVDAYRLKRQQQKRECMERRRARLRAERANNEAARGN